jgi:glutamate synthase domain-containing protein 1
LKFDVKVDKLWFRGGPNGDNNTIFGKYEAERPASLLKDIKSEKTDDFHQSVWPRMHLLIEA